MTPDTAPGPYYVTAVDFSGYVRASGPYPTHEAALTQVNAARDFATDRDPWAWFAAWGTARVPGETRPGVLQGWGFPLVLLLALALAACAETLPAPEHAPIAHVADTREATFPECGVCRIDETACEWTWGPCHRLNPKGVWCAPLDGIDTRTARCETQTACNFRAETVCFVPSP